MSRIGGRLKHYVDHGFYVVVFEHDPRDASRGSALQATGGSRTSPSGGVFRISFRAPVPFYPYRAFGSARRDGMGPDVLALWVVSSEPLVPVGVRGNGNGFAFVRPLAEGWRQRSVSQDLQDVLAGTVGPIGNVAMASVQPFEDQKRSRAGYGDILFLPEDGVRREDCAEVSAFARRVLSVSEVP
jgi:hypothetical protein